MAPNSIKALEAIASPIRQELASALGHRPTTVTALAKQLGRTRQALYHHVGILVAAGLVEPVGRGGPGRGREETYRLAVSKVAAGPRPGSSEEIALAARAVAAMLRLTGRELRLALDQPRLKRAGAGREVVAMRGKARLSERELARLNTLIREVHTLLQQAKSRLRGKMYSVTLVVTPSRHVGDR